VGTPAEAAELLALMCGARDDVAALGAILKLALARREFWKALGPEQESQKAYWSDVVLVVGQRRDMLKVLIDTYAAGRTGRW
jgi:hypothetical protein